MFQNLEAEDFLMLVEKVVTERLHDHTESMTYRRKLVERMPLKCIATIAQNLQIVQFSQVLWSRILRVAKNRTDEVGKNISLDSACRRQL